MRTLSDGLDYYKLTMSQFAWKYNPEVLVTFTLKNRDTTRNLLEFIDIDELQRTLDAMRENGFTDGELVYFLSLRSSDKQFVFHSDFINYIRRNTLPRVRLEKDPLTGDLIATATGPHALVTFWETIVMAEINQAYWKGWEDVQETPLDLNIGLNHLTDKIKVLQDHPEIKFSDFGTRRHFSFEWQKFVVDRMSFETSNFVGTSNLGIAATTRLKPIGTFAHEMPMVMCALADARGEDIADAHDKFLKDWYIMYGDDLSIGLTDTFGDEFFYNRFFPALAKTYRGVRHDSGDPIDFGHRILDLYAANDIDATQKTIVFSDGLDLDTILKLQHEFGEFAKLMYGWGTTLTNDVGVKPLNIVMKATYAHDARLDTGAATVKLSNDAGKHTGPANKIEQYVAMAAKATSLVG